MDIYALSDLHLSLAIEKPMEIFGAVWHEHWLKIEKNWNETVKDDDIVLIPGDISWAMSAEDAKKDIDFIAALKGKKVLLRGNHDYWWDSVSKVREAFKEVLFIQNDVLFAGNIAICGARGWKTPLDESFDKKNDEKIYRRELIRCELSLKAAKSTGETVFMSHYPPVLKDGQSTGFSELIEKYNVKKAVYGHVHGSENFKNIFEGTKNGVSYSLVSADYIGFKPLKIYDSEEKIWL